jgi:hypothetical protein
MRPLEVQKKVEDDSEFDVKKAQKGLRRYVEGHELAIRQKAENMIDHFRSQSLQTSDHATGDALLLRGSVRQRLRKARSGSSRLTAVGLTKAYKEREIPVWNRLCLSQAVTQSAVA